MSSRSKILAASLLHVLIHGGKIFEARRLGYFLILRAGTGLRIKLLELVGARTKTLLGFLEHTFAYIEFPRALVELLTALMQTLKDRAFRRRDWAIAIELDRRSIDDRRLDFRRLGCGSGQRRILARGRGGRAGTGHSHRICRNWSAGIDRTGHVGITENLLHPRRPPTGQSRRTVERHGLRLEHLSGRSQQDRAVTVPQRA